jgi:uncharacterized damage-inducible protein DinB
MQLQFAVSNLFSQLHDLLDELSTEQFTHPCNNIFGASIGQHLRHVAELYHQLLLGYDAGVVNYDHRQRNQQLEEDLVFAKQTLGLIMMQIDRPDKPLVLHADYAMHSHGGASVVSNYLRELIYNLEHTVHHMALIRVAVCECTSIALPEGFGVAASTRKFREGLCVQ